MRAFLGFVCVGQNDSHAVTCFSLNIPTSGNGGISLLDEAEKHLLEWLQSHRVDEHAG